MLQLRRLVSPTTVSNLFTAFTCIIIFAVVLRFCFFDIRDPSKCGALMNEGIWLDRPPPDSPITPTEWQAPGCMIHKYKPTEVTACFADRRILFAGDSTIRQVFWAVAKTLDPDADQSTTAKHSDIVVEKNGATVEFVWDPFLNSSRVKKELSAFADDKYYSRDPNRPALMLVGTGLWYSRFENPNGMKKWRDSIDEVVGTMRYGRTTTDLTHQDLLLLAPVLVPSFGKLNEERKKTITPELVGEMNQYLQQLSDIHGIDVVWTFNQLTHGLPQTYQSSGIHLTNPMTAKQAEILLNLRCNAQIPPKYPYDKTCCTKYEPPNFQQWIGLAFIFAVLPVMSYIRSKAEAKGIKPAAWVPSERTSHALLVFGMAVVYSFYADRTQVFNKFHKHYISSEFGYLTAGWIALGILSIRRSEKPFISTADQPFLSRDQTDEWKGWLQFAILVYHYTGASKIAWIYEFIRVAVACYLFMTGYGHTIYFYKKGDYSFKRVAGVLIRLNLLSCVLPYMMNTEYIFYYFAPLVSFWFLIVYATMRVGAKSNRNTRFVLAKMVISSIFVTNFTKFPGILEAVFMIPHLLAGTEWNVTEFRFRVSLDMWIVYIGMVVAIITIKLSDSSSPYTTSFHIMRKYALIASAIALPLFFCFQSTRENKFVYNAYHPYVSWIPILSFVTLRNATPMMRNYYSGVFAWLGKCSLETFTLQFHIWMAADTHGLLDLGLFEGNRWGNFALATVPFLFISHCVAGASGELTAWIMGVAEEATPRTQLPVTRRDVSGEKSEVEIVKLRELEAQSSGNTRDPQQQQKGNMTRYSKNLKLRCVVILVGMWVLNLTYSP